MSGERVVERIGSCDRVVLEGGWRSDEVRIWWEERQGEPATWEQSGDDIVVSKAKFLEMAEKLK
jgi:hypothetical protein